MKWRNRWLKREREELLNRRKDRDLTKTVEEVFDYITLGHLYRLETRGVLWEIKGVVSSGKEARIYWAKSRKGEDLAVKIYLSFTAEFRKSIRKYIEGDPRFENVSKNDFRKLIYEWTRKEFRNLKRLREAGVRVPNPIAFQGNILVMEFLGEKGYRAPLLVEVVDDLDFDDLLSIWNDIKAQLKKMICDAGLIHSDLSEYNIMLWKDRPWIIDVAQAVHINHPSSRDFLERDLRNLNYFFGKRLDIHKDIELLRGDVLECLRKKDHNL